jgi:excinuclease ABC subunit C
MISSQIEKIPGIGSIRRRALIKRFADIEGIKKASVADIYEVVKNKEIARRLKDTLNT